MMKDLSKKWIIANALSFSIGTILHSTIAHGLTGAHEFWMTGPQLVMHTLGFLTLGLIISFAQRAVFKPLVKLKLSHVLLKAMLFMVGYWAGYFSFGVPANTIVGFAVLGIFSGLELRGKIPHWKRWMTASTAGFTMASLIAVAPLIPLQKIILAAFGDGLSGNLSIWGIIGIFGGISAGLLTAPFLAKSLPSASETLSKLELADNLGRS